MFSLLYIDDEPGLLELGQLFLERTGEFTVTTALSADAGLACLAERDFDAVISDYQMPGMDGISLLKNVRKSFGNIPFVLFTGRGREEIVIEAINNGVDFYLQKGGDPKAQFAELAHKVRQAVNRRQAETALSDSEKRLADIINFLPDATFAIDTQGVVIAWNRAMEQMTGVSSAEILGKGDFEYALPFYRERRPLLINLVLDDDPGLAAKYPFVKKEGGTLFSEITIPHFNEGRGAALWFTASPLYNKNGDVVGAIESIRDITERKQAEEDLISANREYTNLLDQIQDVYYRSDTEGKLVRASRSWATLFGYDDISECLGMSIADDFYVNPSDRKRFLKEIYRNGKVTGYEVLLKKKDGTPVRIEASSHLYHDPAGNIIGVEGTFRDITERKKSEKELHSAYERITANEEKFRSIVETTPDIIWESDLQGKFRYISPRVTAIMGYTPEEVVGRSIIDLVPDAVKPFIIQELPRYASLKKSLLPLEVPALCRDGRELILEIRPSLVGTGMSPEGFRGVAVDITDRKRAEKALKTSEKRFRELAELLPQGIYEADANGTLTYANSRALEMFGHTAEDIKKGLNIRSTIAHKDRQRVETAFGQIAEQRIQPKPMVSTEYLALRKDGTTFPIAIFSSPIIIDGRVTGVRGILMDITERKKAEDALSESERRFRELADMLPQGIYEADITGRLTYANRIAQEMSGYTEEDLRKGLNAMTVFAPEDRQRAAAVFSRMVEHGTRSPENTEYKALRKDGSTFPVSIFSSPVIRDGRIAGVRGIIIDITERKRAEEELRAANEQLVASDEELRAQYNELAESEKRIRMSETRLTFMLGFYEYSKKSEKELLEYAIEGAGIVTESLLGYLAFLNEDESELSMYAWSKKAMAECAMQEKPIIYKTEKTGLWGEAVRQRQPVITNDYAAPNPAKKGYPEGHPRIIRHMNVPVLDEGRIVLVAGVANKPSDYSEKDASELLLLMQGLWEILKRRRVQETKKAADEMLRKSEDELRLLKISVDQSGDEVFWLDFEGNILNVNDTACRVNGYSREEFLGKTIFDLNPDLTPDIWAGSVSDLRQKKTQFITTRHKRKDGTIADVEIMAVYVNQDSREYSFAFVRDITKRRKTENDLKAAYEQLIASEEELREQYDTLAAAEAEISSRRMQLEEIASTVPGIVYQFFVRQDGAKGMYFASNRTREIFGLEPDLETFFPAFTAGVHPDDRAGFLASIDEAVGQRTDWHFEGRFIKGSGETIWFEGRATPVARGDELVFSGVLFDITGRRKMEEAVRESEEKYRSLVENIPFGITLIDADHRIIMSNAAQGQMFHTDAGLWAGRYCYREFEKRDAVCMHCPGTKAMATGICHEVETEGVRDDGTRFNARVHAIPLPDDEGRATRFIEVVEDITERKRAEDALRQNEEKYRTLIETTGTGFVIIDADGRVLDANPEYVRMTGHADIAEIKGRNVTEWTAEHDRARNADAVRQCIRDGFLRNFEIDYADKAGKSIPIEINATVLGSGDRMQIHTLCRDITQRRQAEAALQLANLVVENSPVVLFRWEAKEGWPVAFVSRNVTQFGYTPEELMSGTVPYATIVHPDDRERVAREVQKYSSEGPDDYEQEYRIVTRSGDVHWIDDRTVIERDAEGRVEYYQGTVIDITARKRAEEALFNSQQMLQAVLDSIPQRVFWKDTNSVFLGCNKPLALDAGFSEPADMIGKTDYDNASHETADLYRADDRQVMETGQPRINYEEPQIRSDGSHAWLRTTKVPLRNKEGMIIGVLGTYEDITERKRAEEALRARSEEYQKILQTAMDGFCIVAMDGSFIDVNDAFCTSLGYTREEVLSLSLPHIEVRGNPEETARHMKDIISKGWDRFETRFRQKDGGIIDVEVSVVYTEIHGGRFITFSRDITRRRKETEELRLLKISADHSSDEIFWLDFSGQILYVNDAACRITGYSRDEFLTMKIFELDPDFPPEVWNASVADLRERKTQFITTRHRRKDGVIIDVEIVAVYVREDDQEYSFAYVRDITDRRLAENQVRESEQNYRLLFETAAEGILIAQGDRMVNVNPALVSLLRRPVEVITSRPFTDFIHPDDRELVMSRHLQRMRGEIPPTGYEFRIITGDGQERWVRINSAQILWSNKPASLSFLTDITEQKMADDRLIAANEEYTNLLGQIQDIYYRSDTEGRLVRASRSLAALLGYDDISECIGRNIADDFYLHPADRKHFIEEIDSKGSLTDYEVFLKKRDGTPVLISTNSHVYTDTTGKVIGIEGTFRDITSRKKTENALRESEEKYRTLVETANEGIWTIDADYRTTFTNRKMQELFGYSEREMMGRPVWDFVPPDDAESIRQELLKRLSGIPGRYERRWVRKDGTIIWCLTSATPLLSPEGTFLGSFGMFTDITERRHMEESLRESEEKFRAVIDQSFQFIGLMKTDGTLIEANRAALALVGISESEVINRPFWDTPWWAHSPDLREKLKAAIQRAASGEIVRFEATHPAADGRLVSIDFSVKPVVDPAGKILYLIPEGRDITERKRAEEALRESEEKYRMLVESSFDGIAIHQDGILVYVNRTAARLLGSDDPGVFIGRPAIDLVAPSYRERIMERIREAPDKPLKLIHEQFQRLDGTAIDVDVTSTPGTWKGRPAAFVTFRDITEQKRAEMALRESESRWRQWIEQSPIPIGLYRLDGTGIYSNVHFVRTIGYTLDEIPDMETYLRTMFPDPQYRQEIQEAWEDRVKTSVARGGYIEPLEARITCRDGVTRTLEFTGLVIGDTVLVTFYDLTTRKKAQEALHESEEKYRTLVEVNRDIIYSLDTDGTILYTSPQITAQLGYMPDEIEGQNFSEIVHPDDIGTLVRHIQENFMSGKPVAQDRFRLRRKDGTYRWYEDKSIYATDRQGRHIVSGTIRDITEEKSVQDALRESEEKFRTILDTTSEWIWDLDLHGCHTYSNPAVESLLGYTKDEILGISTFEMIHPDDRDRIEQIFASSVSKKSGWRNVRLRWQHKDGTYRFLESNATAIINERGELTGFRGADRDITESVHAEDALRESEEKFRGLVETTSDFIWEVDAAGVYTYVSPQVYQILGYEPEEMVGRTPFDFMPPEEIEKVTAEFNHCITSRLPIVALENKAIRKDGSVVVLETSGVVRTANDGRYLGYRGIDRDITTRKEAAERTSRLSALKQDLLRTAPLEEKLEQITDGIVEIFRADFARIWMTGAGDLCDKGCIHAAVTTGPHVCRNRKSCLHLIASSGRYTHTDGDHRRVPFGAYKIGRLATGEEAQFITNDVTHDPRVHDHAWAESLGLVSFSGFQLVSPDGEPIGVLAFFSREPVTQDIVDDLDDLATTTSLVIQTGMAEEVQQEREEWARTILNTAQTGIVLIEEETHRILDANPKALGMIGLPRDSVIGKVCHHFICPAEKGNCPVTDGGQVVDTSEQILVTASETMIPVLKTVVAVSLGGKKVLVESFVDISEQKRSEAAIREANRKLNLLSSITRHDVANQLTVVQGYTQLAALSNPEPVIADFLAKIESGIDTIQRQIEFTRTYQDLGVQAPSWFVIADVIHSVGHEGIRLVCTCKSYEIYADPMIGRVFFNLFDNAARYGERVTTVRVGCAKKGKKLVIRFADNGVGIPSIEKKKIFQKGYGKHTGFGLFLAREILAITGITIQESGTYGKGAVFEITVPEGSFRKTG